MLGTAIPVPAAITSGGHFYHTFQVSNEHGRIASIAGRIERWVIDPASFSGRPKTQILRARDRINVRLVDAFYPGTDLSADLTCEIIGSSADCLINLSARLGEFSASSHFLKWLQGATALTGRMKLPDTLVKITDSASVSLGGHTSGGFIQRGTGWYAATESGGSVDSVRNFRRTD